MIVYPLSQDWVVSQEGSAGLFWYGWDLSGNALLGARLNAVVYLGLICSPLTSGYVVFFFRNSGQTPGVGNCQWQRNCLSWKSTPRRQDEGSPGSEMGGKVVAASSETTGLRMETEDMTLTSDLISLRYKCGLSWLLSKSKNLFSIPLCPYSLVKQPAFEYPQTSCLLKWLAGVFFVCFGFYFLKVFLFAQLTFFCC